MPTLALVHGAYHGAWCWEALRPELERRGLPAVAVELPCEDLGAGCVRYAEVVEEALRGEPDDVVLVGQSLAGLVVPLVAAARPVARLVYLCAFLPRPGTSFADQLRAERGIFPPGFGAGQVRDEDGSTEWTQEGATATFYHDCDAATAARAAGRLRRQAQRPFVEPCPLEELPHAAASVVACADDRVVSAAWLRAAACKRLGVEPLELPGGHCPFLSRPAELADLLAGIVA